MKKIFNRYSKYIIIVLIIIILLVFLYFNKEKIVEVEVPVEKECTNNTSYYVEIKGEVNNPGVYEVESDKRIIDVIDIAGGLTNNADTSLLNLSKKVIDEMNIKIYSKSEVLNAREKLTEEVEPIEVIKYIEKECACIDSNDACINEVESNNETENELININTASETELTKIPGIGNSKAKSIIEYRSVTPFTTIEDIKNISGIGDSTFEKIKSYITV